MRTMYILAPVVGVASIEVTIYPSFLLKIQKKTPYKYKILITVNNLATAVWVIICCQSFIPRV